MRTLLSHFAAREDQLDKEKARLELLVKRSFGASICPPIRDSATRRDLLTARAAKIFDNDMTAFDA